MINIIRLALLPVITLALTQNLNAQGQSNGAYYWHKSLSNTVGYSFRSSWSIDVENGLIVGKEIRRYRSPYEHISFKQDSSFLADSFNLHVLPHFENGTPFILITRHYKIQEGDVSLISTTRSTPKLLDSGNSGFISEFIDFKQHSSLVSLPTLECPNWIRKTDQHYIDTITASDYYFDSLSNSYSLHLIQHEGGSVYDSLAKDFNFITPTLNAYIIKADERSELTTNKLIFSNHADEVYKSAGTLMGYQLYFILTRLQYEPRNPKSLLKDRLIIIGIKEN